MKRADPRRWEEVEALLEELFDCDEESRLARLAEVAIRDLDLANLVGRLLAADGIERSALDLDATLLVAAAGGGRFSWSGEAEELPRTSEPAVPSASVPDRIGPYRILRRVGQGSAGEVFEAERDGRRVAIKRLLPMHDGSEIARRFERERAILEALDHPAIARLWEAGTDAFGRAFLVLEWVEGTDLLSFARAQKLAPAERLRLFLRLCPAVAAAHERQIVHRDLKPANILVDREGWPRLLDFGIAALLDAGNDCRQTASGVWLFTLDYAAPEQILGRRPGAAADQFSLTALLWELLADRRPFDRGGRPISQVLRYVERERPPKLPWGDRELREIVARGLAFEPERRHASVQELADRLALWLAEREA